MKYQFSSQVLKILPPDTSFGDAWESLCYALLRAEEPEGVFQRFNPPDLGVDILCRNRETAYQCKAVENGAVGTIPIAASRTSFETAIGHRSDFGWNSYSFATNAHYSGEGVAQLTILAKSNGVPDADLFIYGPDFWSTLCEKHIALVQDRLDFRFTKSEQEVIDAFTKANYFEKYVAQFESLIRQENFNVTVGNNRTPILLELPFSRELTIENLIDVVMRFLGIGLNAVEYAELGTSINPGVSITIDRCAQPLDKKLGDFTDQEINNLCLWIKLIWTDSLAKRKRQIPLLPVPVLPEERMSYEPRMTRKIERVGTMSTDGEVIKNLLRPSEERGQITIERYESTLQESMWRGVIS